MDRATQFPAAGAPLATPAGHADARRSRRRRYIYSRHRLVALRARPPCAADPPAQQQQLPRALVDTRAAARWDARLLAGPAAAPYGAGGGAATRLWGSGGGTIGAGVQQQQQQQQQQHRQLLPPPPPPPPRLREQEESHHQELLHAHRLVPVDPSWLRAHPLRDCPREQGDDSSSGISGHGGYGAIEPTPRRAMLEKTRHHQQALDTNLVRNNMNNNNNNRALSSRRSPSPPPSSPPAPRNSLESSSAGAPPAAARPSRLPIPSSALGTTLNHGSNGRQQQGLRARSPPRSSTVARTTVEPTASQLLSATPPPGFGRLAQGRPTPLAQPSLPSSSASAQFHKNPGAVPMDAAFATKLSAGDAHAAANAAVAGTSNRASAAGAVAPSSGPAAAASANGTATANAAGIDGASRSSVTMSNSVTATPAETLQVQRSIGTASCTTGLITAQIQAAAKSRVAKGPGHQQPFECRRRYAARNPSARRKPLQFPFGMDSAPSILARETRQGPGEILAELPAPSAKRTSEIDRLFAAAFPAAFSSAAREASHPQLAPPSAAVPTQSAQIPAALQSEHVISSQSDIMKHATATGGADRTAGIASIPQSAVDVCVLETESTSSLPHDSGEAVYDRSVSMPSSACTGLATQETSAKPSSNIRNEPGSGDNSDTLAQWFSKLGAHADASKVQPVVSMASAVKDDGLGDEVGSSASRRAPGKTVLSTPLGVSSSLPLNDEQQCNNGKSGASKNESTLSPNVLSFFTAIRAQAAASRAKPEAGKAMSNGFEPTKVTSKASTGRSKLSTAFGSDASVKSVTNQLKATVVENDFVSSQRSSRFSGEDSHDLLVTDPVPRRPGDARELSSAVPDTTQSASVERFFNMFKQDPPLAPSSGGATAQSDGFKSAPGFGGATRHFQGPTPTHGIPVGPQGDVAAYSAMPGAGFPSARYAVTHPVASPPSASYSRSGGGYHGPGLHVGPGSMVPVGHSTLNAPPPTKVDSSRISAKSQNSTSGIGLNGNIIYPSWSPSRAS